MEFWVWKMAMSVNMTWSPLVDNLYPIFLFFSFFPPLVSISEVKVIYCAYLGI